MSRLFISRFNPVKFVNQAPKPAQYNNRHLDDSFYNETIFPWLEQKSYAQKWQTTDSIRLQFSADFNPINIEMIDCNGSVIGNTQAIQRSVDVRNPPNAIYETDLSLFGIPEGYYRLRLSTFGSIPILSEWLHIKDKHEHTYYLEYKNSSYKSIAWETGFSPAIRIEADFDYPDFHSNDQMQRDQPYNQIMINSKPYREHPFVVGGTFGVPPYIIDKLNLIFGLDYTSLDGKLYSKAEAGQEIEVKSQDRYPLRGFIINLTESLNRYSDIFDPNVNTDRKVVIVHNIDTNLFGDVSNQGSTNQVPIITYE